MYQIPGLLKYPKLFHAFSTKPDGNMANSILGKVYDFNQVIKNREKFLEDVGVDIDNSICMWVTHGEKIIKADPRKKGVSMKDYKLAEKVDGLVTDKKGLMLFVLVADCLPIIIYDPVVSAVGLVHAGWKGVDLEIVKKAIDKMKKEYASKPGNLVVGIGPSARKDSFIKLNPSQKNSSGWQPFLENLGEDKYKVDLVGYTVDQLIKSGVKNENIFVSNVDTVLDDRFFSHYREMNLPIKSQGRFACVVGIRS